MNLGSAFDSASRITPAFVLAVGMGTAATTANAQSLELNKCYDVQTLSSVLSQEGQMTISKAAELDGASTARRISSNENGTFGYDIKGTLPYNQTQVRYCVEQYLTNIVPHDREQQSSPPEWLGVVNGDGKTSSDLTKAYAANDRFVLTAQALAPSNRELVYGAKFGILVGNDGTGSMERISPNTGKATSAYLISNFELTSNAVTLFNNLYGQKSNIPGVRAPSSPVAKP